MGWSIGDHNGRDIGYGVPAICDHPGCGENIDRGLSYVCGGEPYGGDLGCGLFFCSEHLAFRISKDRISSPQLCERCLMDEEPFDPTPDTNDWILWKLAHSTWSAWRLDNPAWVHEAEALLADLMSTTASAKA